MNNINSLMNLMIYSMLENNKNHGREINWDYIKTEYNLIKYKKSKLSRKKRDEIIRMWENKNGR